MIHKWNMSFKNMKLEVDMKALRKMELEMAEENSSIKMEDTMMENGKIIKCMVGESYFTKETNQLMKEIGPMINFMAMAKYIMIALWKNNKALTFQILICQTIFGSIIKGCLLMIQKKVEEGSS